MLWPPESCARDSVLFAQFKGVFTTALVICQLESMTRWSCQTQIFAAFLIIYLLSMWSISWPMELFSIFMAGMGEATSLCQSVNLYCALSSLSFVRDGNGTCYNDCSLKVFQLFVLRLCFLYGARGCGPCTGQCMWSLCVETKLWIISNALLVQHPSQKVWFGLFLENIFRYTQHHSDPDCYEQW